MNSCMITYRSRNIRISEDVSASTQSTVSAVASFMLCFPLRVIWGQAIYRSVDQWAYYGCRQIYR